MQETAFNEKLYTSTEVAQILGVSLRSIYRYLDENKIQAAVKTATGRHRFTKENINDFLHPSVQRPVQPVEVKEPSYHEISKQVEHKYDKEEE
ncbi:MAG: helix-turn-helix domain-containing protein, partial [Patescibacteria group bacterium]